MKTTKILVIGDARDGPTIPKSRFLWMGKHIKKTKPDYVIQIGDFLSLDSCCWHIDTQLCKQEKTKEHF